MASSADPYSAFNFLMEWSHPEANNTSKAGFSEVTGLGKEVTVAEYRTGNGIESDARQVAGVSKSSNIILKRGYRIASGVYLLRPKFGSMPLMRLIKIQNFSFLHEVLFDKKDWVYAEAYGSILTEDEYNSLLI
jgi:hypothetical protein